MVIETASRQLQNDATEMSTRENLGKSYQRNGCLARSTIAKKIDFFLRKDDWGFLDAPTACHMTFISTQGQETQPK